MILFTFIAGLADTKYSVYGYLARHYIFECKGKKKTNFINHKDFLIDL